jgi:hypothetical protein
LRQIERNFGRKANEKVYIRKDDIWVIGHVVRKFNDRSYLVKEDGSDVILIARKPFAAQNPNEKLPLSSTIP